MTDIRNRIKTEIKTASERIKSIKDSAFFLVIDAVKKIRYDHINPKHKDWAEYRRLKIEVSLWLAALHLSNPDKDTETKKFLVGSHRPKGVDPTDFTISVAKKIERLREKIKKEACVNA
jgi:hypothetical protein